MLVITRAIRPKTIRSLVDKRRALESIGLNRKSVIAERTTNTLKIRFVLLVLTTRTAKREIVKRLVDVTVHTIEDFK